jgi:hypothetical protein
MADITTPTPVIKPGFKTSEFWLTLGTFLVSGLVLTGVISQDNNDQTSAIVSHVITSVCMVFAQATVVYKYISSRHEAKHKVKSVSTVSTTETTESTPPPVEEPPKPKKPRRKHVRKPKGKV